MKRQSYSFDLNILDNTISYKECQIKISNGFWALSFISFNLIFQIILISEFQLIINIVILTCLTILLYLLFYFNGKDSYEQEKLNKFIKIINYFYYFIVASVFSNIVSLILNHGVLLKFGSEDLSEKYFSILILFTVGIRIFSCFLYKRFIKDNYPFSKIETINEN